MIGNGPAQLRDAPVGQGQQQLFAVVQHHFPLELGPDGEGEMAGAGVGQVHGVFCFLFLSGISGKGSPGTVAFHRFHKIAHLFHGADEALGKELVVGGLHGDLADLQILGQGTLGRQLLPGRQGPGENVLPDAPVKGLVEGDAGGFLEFVC